MPALLNPETKYNTQKTNTHTKYNTLSLKCFDVATIRTTTFNNVDFTSQKEYIPTNCKYKLKFDTNSVP